MTDPEPTYPALFLTAWPQMQCGVGQFTRLLQQTVESSELGSTTALTLTRSEGWTYPRLKIVGHRHGFLRGDALRAKVEERAGTR